MPDDHTDGPEVHTDALGAYLALEKMGGLEPAGRDKDLVGMLIERISPGAADISAALGGTSVSTFLSAMLSTIQPFTSMFTDILAFFERAGAQYGQTQWRLSVGDEFPDLAHFREFIDASSKIAIDFDAPDVDFRHAWGILSAVAGETTAWTSWSGGMSDPTGLPDVDEWLDAYGKGRYLPLPDSLRPEEFPKGWDDLARLIMAVLHVVRESKFTRADLHRLVSAAGSGSPPDIFGPGTLAGMELDNWLGSHVRLLASSSREPPATSRTTGMALSEYFAPFARRDFSTKIDVEYFEGILSLPAWKKRYEGYGVWVATRIVDSIDDHDVGIRHDGGQLPFAFKESLLAEVPTARPPMLLYTERRVPVAAPVGKTRKNNAQPDFSLWTEEEHSRCVLVVEVKHYKKESRRNFGDALVDYAAGHPYAQVVLVNYGPAGADYGTLRGTHRGTVIEHFAPNDRDALKRFRQLVRDAVGDPVRVERKTAVIRGVEAVVIDISASMKEVLNSAWLEELMEVEPDATVHLVDHSLRATIAGGQVKSWLAEHGVGSSTSLTWSLAYLLGKHASVLLVTDEDGAASITGLSTAPVEIEGSHPEARLLRVRRAPLT